MAQPYIIYGHYYIDRIDREKKRKSYIGRDLKGDIGNEIQCQRSIVFGRGDVEVLDKIVALVRYSQKEME